MKNLQDISQKMKMELQATKQARFHSDEDYYVWYMPTTNEHNGGFLILKDKPANPDYQTIAMRLRRDYTEEQNLYAFMEIARKLPILSIH
jgi:hypothetical protein